MKKQALMQMQEILARQVDIVKMLKTDVMLQLAHTLKAADPELRLLSIQLMGLLAKSPVGKTQIIEFSYIADVVRLVTDEWMEVRFHAYECVKSFSDTRDGLLKLVNAAFIGTFIEQSRVEEDTILRVSALLLLDKLMHVPTGLSLAVEHNAIVVCVGNLTHAFEHVRAAACQCLVTINTRQSSRAPTLAAGATPVLIELLVERDLYTRAFAAGALMYLTMELEGKEQCLQDELCMQRLVLQLDENFDMLLVNTLQCIAALAEHPRARPYLGAEAISKHIEYYALIDIKPLIKLTAARALKVIQWAP
jgi:hypothetical protein